MTSYDIHDVTMDISDGIVLDGGLLLSHCCCSHTCFMPFSIRIVDPTICQRFPLSELTVSSDTGSLTPAEAAEPGSQRHERFQPWASTRWGSWPLCSPGHRCCVTAATPTVDSARPAGSTSSTMSDSISRSATSNSCHACLWRYCWCSGA